MARYTALHTDITIQGTDTIILALVPRHPAPLILRDFLPFRMLTPSTVVKPILISQYKLITFV